MRNSVGGWFGARVRIDLAQNSVAILRKHAGWRRQSAVLADQPLAEHSAQEPQRLTAQCKALLADAACAGLPLTVTVADNWARLFMVAPPHNAGRMQDLQAAAAMRFQSLYGELPSAWEIQADWQAGVPFLACALPRPLLAALQQIAIDHKLHLLSVEAQFVAAWNTYARTLPKDTWFGVAQDHNLTLGAIAQAPRRLHAVRSIAIPDDGDEPRWLQEQVARAALQLNLPMPTQLHLAGKQRPKWSASGGTLTVRNLEQKS